VIMAFSTPETDEELPYASRPFDKGGHAMPQRLWDLVRSCWKRDPTSRPAVQHIVDVISEISAQWIRRVPPAEGPHPENATVDPLPSPHYIPVQPALGSPEPGISGQQYPPDHALGNIQLNLTKALPPLPPPPLTIPPPAVVRSSSPSISQLQPADTSAGASVVGIKCPAAAMILAPSPEPHQRRKPSHSVL
jgi:hypothetical protein